MQVSVINPRDIVELGVPNYCHGMMVTDTTNWLHLSGQVGVKLDGSVSHNFEEQCRQAFSNIGSCLREASMGFGNVIMLRIYLTDRSDLEALRKVRSNFFGERQLSSTLVFVSSLVDPNWRVELEVVAAS